MRLASLLCAWMAAWSCRVRVRACAVARLLVLRRPSAGARISQHSCSLSLSHLHVCAVYGRHIGRRFRAHALQLRTTKVHRLSWFWCCSAAGGSCLLVSTMSSSTAILYFSSMLLYLSHIFVACV